MLELAVPAWLLAVPLPWLAWWVIVQRKPGTPVSTTAPAIKHAQADILFNIIGNTQPHFNRTPWLWIIGCACMVIALARPQWIESAPNTYKGRDFLLALDVSGSMRAQDFDAQGRASAGAGTTAWMQEVGQRKEPLPRMPGAATPDGATLSRLDMLKQVVNQFLSERHGDRIGLIVFADDAYTLSPLTSDMNIVRSLLKEVRHGMAGEKTALGTAMALAVKRLQDREAKARILILLTDGSNTAGEIHPDAAAALAAEEGIRIYTVGIGSHQTVPFPRGPNEKPAYTEMPLDEDLLRRIAERTQGRYYAAAQTEEVQRIISDIEKLEKINIIDSALVQHIEWYWLPLIAGLALLMVSRSRARNEVLP